MEKILKEMKENKLVKELIENKVIKSVYLDGDQDINVELGYNTLISIDQEWNSKFRIPCKEFKYENVNEFTKQTVEEFGGDEFTTQTFILNLLKIISHLHEELEEIIMRDEKVLYLRCPELDKGFRVDISREDHFNEYETTVALYKYSENLGWTTFTNSKSWFKMNRTNKKYNDKKYNMYKYNWDRSVNF